MLELKNIQLKLGAFSLKSVTFTVEKGDYFILLGVSGAGKSMILETIAGLTKPNAGTIVLDGKEITQEKIQHRRVGLVFQDHAIFPHLSVRENIAYSLYNTAFSRVEKQGMIEDVARQMEIENLLHRRPTSLSGGELQRVALARTLVQKPTILLLDEPLASMDVQLRYELRSLLRQLNKNGQTIIHVTHDYDEAISLGNKIAVVHKGSILQQGSPEEVFHYPASEFVAHFTGTKNFFPARSRGMDNPGELVVDEKVTINFAGQDLGAEGFVMLRNEDIFLSASAVKTSALNNFKGMVKEITPARYGVEVLVDIGIPLYVSVTQESKVGLELRENQEVWVHFKASAVRFLKKD
jgi:molybdopterin-binding protein